MIGIFWNLLFLGKWAIIGILVFLLWDFIINPFIKRRHFKKYPQIQFRKGWKPIVGDSLWTTDLYNKGTGRFGTLFRNVFRKREGKPYTLICLGKHPVLMVQDVEKMEEI
jgi:hypothetical protein